ncbi:MAG: hypothetical protein CSA33_03805 [Desulfobulbus propionicus]|nr:MAG: hypothetical protein CSA33_03805 [Desulfobulbus propionicus]
MRLIPLLLIIPTLAGCPETSHCLAGESQPIKRHRLTISKLHKEMKYQSAKIQDSDRKQTSLLDQLERLDDNIAAQQEKVLAIQDKIREQERLIESRAAEIDAIHAEKKALQAHLEKRLRAYYLMGNNGFLRIAFSSTSIPDLLIFNDSFQHLVSYDSTVFSAYRKRKQSILQAKQAHELEKSVQESFLHNAEEEKKTLLYISRQKNQLLQKAKTEKSLYQLALKEMRKAEQDLTAQIARLQKKEENKKKVFVRNMGTLQPPAKGILLSRFGKEDSDSLQKKVSQGITIKTRDGAKVHAVLAGKVIFAGYMRGYGRTIIIDHGYNYFTVTSRLENFVVQQGDTVQREQVIATTGDIATLFGRGLYFEIRKGTTAEDPLPWLCPDAFSSE